MASAAMTSKGQITIPIKYRRKLGLKPGDRVNFVEGKNGELVLQPKNRSIMDLKGAVKWTGKPVSIEDMNKTIAKGWSGLLTFEDE